MFEIPWNVVKKVHTRAARILQTPNSHISTAEAPELSSHFPPFHCLRLLTTRTKPFAHYLHYFTTRLRCLDISLHSHPPHVIRQLTRLRGLDTSLHSHPPHVISFLLG